MASTPSASALSAILRFRGNIWSRNPPTKRPVTSVCGLGPAGEAICDPPAERNRSNQASAWEAFLQEGRVMVVRGPTVAVESPRVDGRVLRERDSAEINVLCHPKVSQLPEDAHPAVPGVNALVRQLQRSQSCNLHGKDKHSKVVRRITHEIYSTHICKIVRVQEISEFPACVLKVSITSLCLMENAAQIPPVVLTGWSALRSGCLSLTALVSELMFLKLAGLSRSCSSPDDASQHLLSQKDGKDLKNDALQDKGQTNASTDLISTDPCSGQRITGDRPD